MVTVKVVTTSLVEKWKSSWPGWLGALFLSFLLVQLLCQGALSAAVATVLVANPDVPVDRLSRSEVKNIFLARIKTVHGVRVRPVLLRDSELTTRFLKDEVGKTPSQFSNYYKKMIFTGRGRPPRKTVSEKEMLDYVSRTGGAIGYVSADAVTGTVKVIQVTE